MTRTKHPKYTGAIASARIDKERLTKLAEPTPKQHKGKITVVNGIANNIVIHLRNVIGLHVGDSVTVKHSSFLDN